MARTSAMLPNEWWAHLNILSCPEQRRVLNHAELHNTAAVEAVRSLPNVTTCVCCECQELCYNWKIDHITLIMLPLRWVSKDEAATGPSAQVFLEMFAQADRCFACHLD